MVSAKKKSTWERIESTFNKPIAGFMAMVSLVIYTTERGVDKTEKKFEYIQQSFNGDIRLINNELENHKNSIQCTTDALESMIKPIIENHKDAFKNIDVSIQENITKAKYYVEDTRRGAKISIK